MTETSYTAWDDKLYQWPPPDGWYEAGDGKWWPEGYGPGPVVSADAAADPAAVDDGAGSGFGAGSSDGLGVGEATFDPAAAGLGALGNGDGAAASAAGAVGAAGAALDSAGAGAGDALGQLSGAADQAGGSLTDGVDAIGDIGGSVSDRLSDAASDAGSSAGGLAGRLSDSAGDLTDGASGSAAGLADQASNSVADLAGRATEAASDAVPGDGAPAPQTASEVLARLTGRSSGDGAATDQAREQGGSLSDSLSGRLSGAMPDGVTDAVPGSASDAADAASDAVSDAMSDAVPDGLTDGFSGASESASDALSGAADRFGDLPGSVPESLSDAAGGAAANAADSFGEAVPDALRGPAAGSALGGLRDNLGSSDLTPGLGDVPDGDDVGAALAETLGARDEAISDPASSGIPGPADLVGERAEQAAGSAADAAAEASQFFTADIPASDLAKGAERPPTDLDALPPPSFDPPGFAAPADGLGGLADQATELAPDLEPSDPGATLFAGSTPSADGGDAPSGRSIAGFELPPDETMPPPSGPESVGGPAAASLGLPLSTSGSDPDAYGRPDETIVAPLAGAADVGQNPAETGQFPAGAAEAPDWGSPASDPYNAPPPGPDGPGGMPWGQAPGAPGGPPFAGGLDPAVLQDNRSGSGRTLMFVGLGVLFLVLAGIAAFLLWGGGSDDAGDTTGPGSFAEPHARSTPVEVFYPLGDGEQRFVIQVLEPLRDASGQADGAAPAEGQRFAVTRVRVANQSATDASVSDLRFNAITSSGTVIDRASNSCTITEPALDFAAVLGEAGVAEGVVCWVVPAADYDGLLLGIESTQVSGRIHIDLQ